MTTRRPATVVALLLAMFVSAVETTVVSTAMPTVVAELGGALHYAWVFSAYMLALTVMVPIYGKLADLYGRKPVILVAMTIFLVGSVATGCAKTMTALILFRAVQGLGVGGVHPVALTIIGDIFPVEERARMQGLFGSVWGVAGLAGPFLGGLIVSALSWRWVFFINVPVGLVAAIILWRAYDDPPVTKRRALDLAGAALCSASIVALLLAVEGIAARVLVPASALLAGAFVLVERRAPEPMLSPKLFLRRAFTVASVLVFFFGAVMIGLTTFVPLYAQGVLAASPTAAGATIMPMVVAWPVASAIAARLVLRVGFRPMVRLGSALVAVAAVGLALGIARGATTTELAVVGTLMGAGMGTSNIALVLAVQTMSAYEERGVATASTMFFRSIGSTIGVGVMGASLSHALLASPVIRGEGGAALVAQLLGRERGLLPEAVLRSIAGDLASAIAVVAWIAAGIALAALAASWLFPPMTTESHRAT